MGLKYEAEILMGRKCLLIGELRLRGRCRSEALAGILETQEPVQGRGMGFNLK